MSAKSHRQTSILLILLAVLALTSGAPLSALLAVSAADAQTAPRVPAESFRSSPVMFIENAGQWPEAARFQVWGGTSGTMWLAEDAIWLTVAERTPVADSRADRLRRLDPAAFDLQPADQPPARGVNIKLSFVDANPHPRIEPFDRLDTVVSYFIGNDPDRWRPDVPVWGGVRYVDLYPGVDLEITSEDGRMVQRLAVQPSADLSTVRLRVEGADEVTAVRGVLRLNTDAGEATWPLLRIATTSHVSVPRGEAQVFDVEAPFASPESIPQSAIANLQSPADNPADLAYSTFLGGDGGEQGYDIATDRAGSAYVTGETNSGDFPTMPGAFDRSLGGSDDAFVVKFSSTGNNLVYATFVGGGGSDGGRAIAIDASGSAYVTGRTNSSDFPITSGSFDNTQGGGYCHYWTCYDLFVIKLGPEGAQLNFGTFLGGNQDETQGDIAVDQRGLIYVTGATQSSDFPTTGNAFDRAYAEELCLSYTNRCPDAFVSKFSENGERLLYSSFLGGKGLSTSVEDGVDAGMAIAVDDSDKVVIVGETSSVDFPTTTGAFDRSRNGGTDGFVTKVDTVGGGLLFSTLFGGSSSDSVDCAIMRSDGSVLTAASTTSSDFPTTSGAFDRGYNGGVDVAVAQLNSTGSALVFSTLLGGASADEAFGIAIDSSGRISVAGVTQSTAFPTTQNAFDRSYNGGSFAGDAFIARLNASGSGLLYSSFLGGNDNDAAQNIALDVDGFAYVTGYTYSAAFPTTQNAFDRSYNPGNYGGDAFVAKLAMGGASTPTPTPTSTRTPTPTVTPTPTRTPTPTPLPDLRVARIEVAQVFVEQNDPISGTPIPLIAEKDTLVRVYVGLTGTPSVYGVTARLHLRNAFGIERTITKSANPWPVMVTQNPDPLHLQDTINFRPPPEWLWGNVTFWADVDPENRIPETDENNNTGGQVSRTFEAGKPVRIAITQIGYRSFPWGPYAYADWNTIAGADAMLGRVYPVAAGDVQYYYQPGDPARVQCLWGDQDACWAEFHNQLKAFWRRVDDEGQWVGGTRPHALVGWVPGAARDAGSTCGEANRLSPREVVIADYCDKYMGNPLALTPEPVARVLAHEVGHLLNTKPELQHAKNQPNKDDPQCSAAPDKLDPLYPTPPSYPMGSIFAHGLDMSNANPKVLEPKKTPLATYDLMSYCSPAWISPYNYFKLNTGFTDAAAAQASDAEPDALVRKLLVSGLVFTPTLQVELNPFYVLNTTSAADADSGTDYCLEARNASGVVLDKRCFDLAFVNRETYAPASVDGFALAVPYPNSTTQIVLTRKGTPIASRVVSPHAPTVRLLSPNGGETWAGTGAHTVTWTASDLDGDTLHFALAYSTDGGASWIPAGSNLTGAQHALDVSLLPGGTSVLLRISATDGVNTTDDVSDAPFTVGRKAPMAFILSPEDGARFFPGQAIWLEGRAFDLEDGALGDAALQWSSDRDGVLGTGKLLMTSLSPGKHTITLTATDSDGARSTATIRLSAGDRVFLPMVLR